MNGEIPESETMTINEVQLLLPEKRASLSVMRTGIAVLALPLSVFGVLIATSRYYSAVSVLHFLIPLEAINVGLIVFGVYLIGRSILRMRRYDRLIAEIKLKHRWTRKKGADG